MGRRRFARPLGRPNRQYIEEVIPHIGSVLSADLEAVLKPAEVVILGNKSASKDRLAKLPFGPSTS